MPAATHRFLYARYLRTHISSSTRSGVDKDTRGIYPVNVPYTPIRPLLAVQSGSPSTASSSLAHDDTMIWGGNIGTPSCDKNLCAGLVIIVSSCMIKSVRRFWSNPSPYIVRIFFVCAVFFSYLLIQTYEYDTSTYLPACFVTIFVPKDQRIRTYHHFCPAVTNDLTHRTYDSIFYIRVQVRISCNLVPYTWYRTVLYMYTYRRGVSFHTPSWGYPMRTPSLCEPEPEA